MKLKINRTLLFLLISLFLPATTFSQDEVDFDQQEVISTAGDQFANASYQLSWTLGETISESYIHPEYVLTQGFHQSSATIIPRAINNVPESEISIYPNPVTDFVYIGMNGRSTENCSFQLRDIHGRLLIEEKINGPQTSVLFSVYPPAVYLLNLSQDQQIIESFKIIKIY